MIKKITQLICASSFILLSTITYAQVGIGTTAPDASASLEINSTTTGILIPRMTEAQKLAIATPATGLLIYETDTAPGFWYYDGATWTPFGGMDNDWTVAGNDMYNANTGNVGVGTATPSTLFHISGSGSTTDLNDGFEDNTIAPFTTFGDRTWQTTNNAPEVNTGTFAARTRSNQNDGQTSSLQYVTGALPAAGTVSFAVTTSTEANFDVLEFFIDGISQGTWSGTNAYATVSYPLTAGTHTLLWTYTKDGSVSSGLDRVAIDDVIVSSTGAIFRLQDGSEAAGLVLTSDANGNATWQAAGGGASTAWDLLGNAGTNPATNFLGTTDAQDLVIRSNNTERIRVGTTETVFNEPGGNHDFRVESANETNLFTVLAASDHVYVRQPSPFPTIDMFISNGDDDIYPINGYARGENNSAVYGQHLGSASATAFNAAGAFDGTGGLGFSSQAGWDVGIVATGLDAGVYGTSTASAGVRYGGYFHNSTNGTTIGATTHIAGFDGTDYYGGYFDGNQTGTDHAWVGINTGGTDYKILGPGTVSTIVDDEQGKGRVMFAPEAPEVLFQDYGSGELVNGKATIQLDPILAKNILVDDSHPLRVFVQLEGDCNGVFVTNKTANGFEVTELAGGTSNTKFTWTIAGSRVDRKDSNGNVTSKFQDIRFPYAPERSYTNPNTKIKSAPAKKVNPERVK